MLRRSIDFAAAVCALFLALASPRAAHAQCSPVTLVSGVPQVASAATTNLNFSFPTGTWVAVGARSAAGSNHSLAAYANTAGNPTCVSGLLASSQVASGVDVVVGDYRPGSNPSGTRQGQLVRSQGAGSATIEQRSTARMLIAGAAPESLEIAPTLFHLYQAFLEVGITYTLNFQPAGADQRLLVFTNPGGGAYWGSRSGSSLLVEANTPTLFTPPTSDDYALVVVNENGGAGSYSLWVELCQAPDTLASGVASPATYPNRNFMGVADPYWQAVGVRSAPSTNWNIAVYDTGRGSPEPTCFGGLRAESNRASGVDFVVGDLSSGPVKPFYARETRASGGGGALVEWDGGPDEVAVDDTANPIVRTTGPTDVLEVWDVRMDPAQTFTIRFEPSGEAALRWFLLDNPGQGPGGAAWKGRDQAVLSGTGFGTYTPTSDSWHALVVVNENGAAGGYSFTVTTGALVAAGAPPARGSGISGIAPNPLQGFARIGFVLAQAARVRIDVVDVSGRRVATIDGGSRPAGAGSLTWEGRGDSGARLAAGVYFARLFVDEAPLGAARMVLVR